MQGATLSRQAAEIEQAFYAVPVLVTADECWEWLGTRLPRGYGRFSWDGTESYAHRLAWAFVNGPIPEGLVVCHRCDNPPCVNPAHLFVGTQADNVRDRDAKGRGRWNPPVKVTDEQVREIRERSVAGAKRTELAREYGLSRHTVSAIARGLYRQAAGGSLDGVRYGGHGPIENLLNVGRAA